MDSEKEFAGLAEEILQEVGGQNNVEKVVHCATRLRFNLKDESIPDAEKIKKINGVLGVVSAGGQLQVVIGPNVPKVYAALNLSEVPEIKKDTPKDTITKENKKNPVVSVLNGILDALSGSLGPVIPVITASAFFKMIVAIFGPSMLGWIAEGSDLYTLCTFVGDAGFYFFPVIIGYTAAKKFNVLPVLGILLGGIMIHPTLIGLVGGEFSVFGIPASVQNYSSTILPIIMSVWAMSYVEKFFNKYLPTVIRSVFGPAFTILVMLPIALCILGPAGAFLGNYVVGAIFGLQNIAGFLGVAIISAIWPLLVMSGMHMVLIAAIFQIFSNVGYDSFAAPALSVASFAIMGVCLGASIKIRNKEQKALAFGFFLSAIIAGLSEPCLYGICIRYKKPFIGLMAGGFIGGLYTGITNTTSLTLVPSSNIFAVLPFAGGAAMNMVNGVIGCIIAFAVSAVITYFWGFDKNNEALKA